MKKRKDTSRVTIEIYDEEGLLCESVGGLMTHQEVKDKMLDVLRNDGIPVIRQHAKHEAVEKNMIGDAMLDKLPELKDIAEKVLKDFKPQDLPETIPMVLDYEFDGIKFHACGHPLDVHAANNALLKRIFKEEN